MRKRLSDYRTGYFATDYIVYGDDQQEVKGEAYIHRWRLEPRAEDMEKWKRGELVEPQKANSVLHRSGNLQRNGALTLLLVSTTGRKRLNRRVSKMPL